MLNNEPRLLRDYIDIILPELHRLRSYIIFTKILLNKAIYVFYRAHTKSLFPIFKHLIGLLKHFLLKILKDLVKLVNEIQDKGCGLVSLKENIDTSTPTGKLTFHLFASLAEFERDLIRERTQAGMLSARSRGRKGGRPQKLTNNDKDMIRKLMSDRNNSAQDIAKRFGVSRATVYTVAKGVKIVSPDEPIL